MNLRKKIFYMMDQIKNTSIKNHIEEIDYIQRNQINNDVALSSLLEHATHNVEFYEKYKEKPLSEFPIINKWVLIENKNKFQSLENQYHHSHVMETSGSTGVPFRIFQDERKRSRVIAELIYFNELGGQVLGEKYLHVKKFSKRKSRITQFVQNEVSLDLTSLDDSIMEKIIKTITTKNIKSILGYGSTYERLSKYIDEKEIKFDNDLKVIFSSSSVLDFNTKLKLSNQFNCSVIDRYSNQENGVLAQTEHTEGPFIVNRGSYNIELLKINSDEYCKPNEMGRIIITDLYNYSMPMIRYDSGDLGITNEKNTHKVSKLLRIEGRKSDVIFNTINEPISPHSISVFLRQFSEIKQWQFIQLEKNKYKLKLNIDKVINYEDTIKKGLKNIVGDKAFIEIIYTSGIPILDSGKYKSVVCKLDDYQR